MSRTGKRKKIQTKKYLLGMIILLVVGIAVVVGLGIWKQRNLKKKTENAAYTQTEKKKTSGTITYEGKDYEYNDHLSNFLFMGIDKRELVETTKGQADAGQADAIFLISWDRVEHKMSMVSIPRDTMTEIEVFDQNGDSLGKTKDHINLAYAYGDGKKCEL